LGFPLGEDFMIRLLVVASCISLVLASGFASESRGNPESFEYDDFEIKLSEAETAVNQYIKEAPQGVYRDFLRSFSECNIVDCSYMLVDKYNNFVNDQRKICLELMAPVVELVADYKKIQNLSKEGQNLNKDERQKLQEKVLNLYENREEVRTSSFSDPKLVVVFYQYLCLSTADEKNSKLDYYLSYFLESELLCMCLDTGYEQYKVKRDRTMEESLYGYDIFFPNLYEKSETWSRIWW
jgi:hypothetical protein